MMAGVNPTSSGITASKAYNLRCLIAYWILGLCNNYGYVVMLTAAEDIINGHSDDDKATTGNPDRNCTLMSTGAILLADILPALFIKISAPFIPFHVHVRVVIAVLVSISSYLMVAYSISIPWSIFGVVLTSFCSGLGEVTFLQYSSFYNKNVVSTWSSGTGGAGVIGALSYSLLQNFGTKTTLTIMTGIPVVMAIAFWVILPRPENKDEIRMKVYSVNAQREIPSEETIDSSVSLKYKLSLIPGLMKYMIPLGLVYLFEYFINQGTFELIRMNDGSVNTKDQYRWLQVTYQIGVFASRSSVNIIHIKHVWIMAVLQALNVIIYVTEVIFYYIPNFYIVVALTFWEGLLGGAAYVNTFYSISEKTEEKDRQFSMAITSFADSIGISLAGVLAIYAHNKICDLPLYN